MLAALVHRLGDFELAEEALQEAAASALQRWPSDGVPDAPTEWLVTVAGNRSLDRLRRRRTAQAKYQKLRDAGKASGIMDLLADSLVRVGDERLSLIFTCAHPALAEEARVALTLQAVGGLTAAEIARAFLVSEATMALRLVRAKRKIRDARFTELVGGRHGRDAAVRGKAGDQTDQESRSASTAPRLA
jgi:RNA polymerase sigma-70 factor, ECF subfamily